MLTAKGEWIVVQQGMKPDCGAARRYHGHSERVRDFVDDPHSVITGEHQGHLMNLVDLQAAPARNALLNIAHENPDATIARLRHLKMPGHHEVLAENVDLKRLGAVLAIAYERELRDFAGLLLVAPTTTCDTPGSWVSGMTGPRNR